MKRVVLIGCVSFSDAVLKSLVTRKLCIVVGVCTNSQSTYNSDAYDLTKTCKDFGVDTLDTKDINSQESIDWISSKAPDLLICVGWSRLLSSDVLSIPKERCIGFHPALLPHNKGRHPLIWALALGLLETGTSFFEMTEEADSGTVISQRKIGIPDHYYAKDLYDQITNVALTQLDDLFDRPLVTEASQEPAFVAGNTWRKRSFKDGIIDWRMSAISIRNLVRALSDPYPGAVFRHEDQYYKVLRADVIESNRNNDEPGKIIEWKQPYVLIVKTGDDLLEIALEDSCSLSPSIDYL